MAPETNSRGNRRPSRAQASTPHHRPITGPRLRQSEPVRHRGAERGRRRGGKATDFRFCRDRTPPTCLQYPPPPDPTASGEALTCPYLRVRVVACSTKPLLAILLAKRTAWKKAQPVTQDAAWTIYSMRGRAGAEGLGRALRHPPPAARVARPRHFTFAHQLRVFQCLLQKANGPVPDQAVPAPLHRADNRRARGMSIYPPAQAR